MNRQSMMNREIKHLYLNFQCYALYIGSCQVNFKIFNCGAISWYFYHNMWGLCSTTSYIFISKNNMKNWLIIFKPKILNNVEGCLRVKDWFLSNWSRYKWFVIISSTFKLSLWSKYLETILLSFQDVLDPLLPRVN